MYPKEEKERVLSEMFESGFTLAAFAKLAGKPARQTLTRWRDEMEAGKLDVPLRRARGYCAHQKHEPYPNKTKREALSLLRKGLSPSVVAHRLGVSSGSVVSSWVKQAQRAKMSPEEALAVKKNNKNNKGKPDIPLDELKAELDEAQIENAVLRELMRNPKVADPEKLSNMQKAELGEKLRRDFGYSLKRITDFLKMPKSTYAYNKNRAKRAKTRADAVASRVRLAFESSKRIYGYRRVHALIISGADGFDAMRVSEHEVRAAMKAEHMSARKTKSKIVHSSYDGETDKRPINAPLKVDGTHNFFASRPDEFIVTDVTEFKAGDKKIYLSPIIDCFDGMPVAWSISLHPDSALSDSSLRQYLKTLPKDHPPLIGHSDGGGLYRSNSWKRLCRKHRITRSMSRKSCCADNARAEGFFGTLKEEFYHDRDWSQTSPENFTEQLDEFLTWYRDERLKAFRENNKTVYDTLTNRRRRLGYVA